MRDDIAALCAALKDEIGPGLRDDRDCIETLVARGRISPEQAEEWAVECEQIPFEERPDSSKLNPVDEPYWTLPMALAWAAWRTSDAVRMCWGSYVARCRVWQSYSQGYRLMPLELPSIHDVGWKVQVAEVEGDPTLKLAYGDAMYQLTNALKEGRTLIARHGKKDIQVIPARMWDVLCSFVDVPHLRRVDAIFDNDANIVFERVRVDRDDVIKIWPALPVAGMIEMASTNLSKLSASVVSAEGRDVVPPPALGSRPRITGEKLFLLMNEPLMDGATTNSEIFLSEARHRAKKQGRSVDQAEVRALYVEMYGRRPPGRPPGQKSRSEIP